MKLFFDFDDFFFDTENAYAPDMFMLIRETTGATEEEMRETFEIFSLASFSAGTPYSVRRHVDLLAERRDFDRDAVMKIVDEFLMDLTRYVFEGAAVFLSKYAKDDLWILTYGEDGFQRQKIHGSGLEDFFHEIIVASGNKLDEIDRVRIRDGFDLAETVVFGDNRCEYFSGAKERGIIGIHLKRPGDKYSLKPCGECEYRVSDFEELSARIERIRKGA
jgi:FMN phosphatase YigB (HAD superfamily)